MYLSVYLCLNKYDKVCEQGAAERRESSENLKLGFIKIKISVI